MEKILDNPKKFFTSLSAKQFKNLLKEFQFKYEEIEKDKGDDNNEKIRQL